MKYHHYFMNIILLFWFVWFALAGIAITAFINWIMSANYLAEDILITGATIGIITGGVAAVMLFLLQLKKYGPGFMDDHPVFKYFKKPGNK